MLPKKQQKKLLEERYLNRDGKRHVVVTRGESKRILGRPCRRLVITENKRTIVDAFVTETVAGGRSFFNLYRRLGTFSSEVLAKLKGVPGLPLSATITVVTKMPTYTLEVEVKKIEERQILDSAFELPRGAKKVVKTPDVLRCSYCDKEVEKGRAHRILKDGRLHYFCNADCARKWLKRGKR